jgi:hypothetical protein
MADELAALEASIRRRKQLGQALFAAFVAAPVVLIGYCVKKAFFTARPPSTEIPLSADELRSAREVMRAHDRLNGPTQLSAPAAVLQQLRTAAPGDFACSVALRARAVGQPGYQPPTFDLVQLTAAELAAATADDRAEPVDDVEVVFVAAERHDGWSDGVTFYPGHVRGRAYLWSRGGAGVICAADVEATNSDSVDVTRPTIGGVEATSTGAEDRGALQADLDRHLEQAIASGLRAVRVGSAHEP